MKAHKEGLICLSGCLHSRLAHEVLNGTQESLLAQVKFYRELFGEDYYFELSRHTMNDGDIRADGMLLEPWLYQQYQSYTDKQTKVNQALVALGQELNIPLLRPTTPIISSEATGNPTKF